MGRQDEGYRDTAGAAAGGGGGERKHKNMRLKFQGSRG